MDRLGRRLAASTALMLASGLLAACTAGASSSDTLTWYVNPDAGGQEKVAENCSTDAYKIEVQVLPQNATEQRVQLSRRLAAEDPEIDIMSIDPPYTAEFANAGFLAPIPDDLQGKLKQQSFKGAVDAATWDGELVVAPFWSNTQVLWYRKSFVEEGRHRHERSRSRGTRSSTRRRRTTAKSPSRRTSSRATRCGSTR